MSKAYQFSDIEFSYDREPALQAAYLAIEENAVHALLGANGSGKTTLLNLLAFVCQPGKGNIRFFDQPVTTVK